MATRIALKIWKDYLRSAGVGDLASGQALIDRSLKRKVSNQCEQSVDHKLIDLVESMWKRIVDESCFDRSCLPSEPGGGSRELSALIASHSSISHKFRSMQDLYPIDSAFD